MACSRDVMADTLKTGCWDLAGREERFDSSTIAPLSPFVMTFSFHDLLSVSPWNVSATRDDFFCSLAFVEPFEIPLDPARKRSECFKTCSKKSFLMNSLTRTTSGAYGDAPPNAKRAVTSCSAADARSAVRSTIAMILFRGETSCEYVGGLICFSWKTCTQDDSESEEGSEEMTAKVSDSRASVSSFRSKEGSARRLFSSYSKVRQREVYRE